MGDADYLKCEQGMLFDLVLAANYLEAKGLMKITSKTVANMMKGKTVEEIRSTFNIRNIRDFTEAEQEIIRKANEWC